MLKILFNGGEDGDAIPLESLEDEIYHSLLATNAAYNLETDQLIEEYKLASQKHRSLKLNGKPSDRSKTVYHSKNTIRHRKRQSIIKKDEHRRSSVNTPTSDSILRMLRMRQDRHVVEFLKKEFEKRNSPVTIDPDEKCYQLPESPTSLTDQKKDRRLSRHSIPDKGITLTD